MPSSSSAHSDPSTSYPSCKCAISTSIPSCHQSPRPARRRRRTRRIAAAAALALLAVTSGSVQPAFGVQAKFSALDRPRSGFFEDVLEAAADQKSCKPTGLIEDTCCDFQAVEDVNGRLQVELHDLVQRPYFRYHKVDLYRECPFWEEDSQCAIRACGVETLDDRDEEHIAEHLRTGPLSELKEAPSDDVPTELEDGCIYRESDFCVREDFGKAGSGVWVDLLQNPERFTGYAGPSASRVWKAIYEENCFGAVPYLDPSRGKDQGGQGFASLSGSSSFGSALGGGSMGGGGEDASGWGTVMAPARDLMGSLAGPRDGGDEMCLEKRVFYRLVSGLHASISIHICDDYLNQTTGEWGPNLECFVTRIGQHPERLQNVYFDYVLMLRALHKAAPYLTSLDLCTGSDSVDAETRKLVKTLTETVSSCPGTFDERSMFTGPGAEVLKAEFKEHFRNISRIMDCVGCDKCRLWGKMQITGLGTALKLLFSYDDPSTASSSKVKQQLHLDRAEIVAFFNTLHRLSESLAAIEKFRELWAARTRGVKPDSHTKKPQREIPPDTTVDASIVAPQPTQQSMARKANGYNETEPSVAQGEHSVAHIVTGGREAVKRVVETCRESVGVCLQYLAEVAESIGIAKAPGPGDGNEAGARRGGEL